MWVKEPNLPPQKKKIERDWPNMDGHQTRWHRRSCFVFIFGGGAVSWTLPSCLTRPPLITPPLLDLPPDKVFAGDASCVCCSAERRHETGSAHLSLNNFSSRRRRVQAFETKINLSPVFRCGLTRLCVQLCRSVHAASKPHSMVKRSWPVCSSINFSWSCLGGGRVWAQAS